MISKPEVLLELLLWDFLKWFYQSNTHHGHSSADLHVSYTMGPTSEYRACIAEYPLSYKDNELVYTCDWIWMLKQDKLHQ